MQHNPLLKRVGLYLGPLAFVYLNYFAQFPSIQPSALSMLAVTLWVAIWWISEAIPLAATSLLPLILLPILNVMPISAVSTSYSHPMVLLYMGGFFIAMAIEKWNLHKRIALNIIMLIGSNISSIVLGFMISTAFLSMWISNTATSLMMLPIGMAVITQLTSLNSANSLMSNVGKALMLGIAYSASIGGLGTIIGTPTNIIFAAMVKETFGYEITFYDWFIFAFPLSTILLFICWLYLTKYAFDIPKGLKIEGGKEEIKNQLSKLGKITYEEVLVLIVFFIVSFLWITRTFIFSGLIPALDDTIIALLGAILLFLLPSSKKNEKILDWKTAQNIPWGILLLFGGGLAIAEGFKNTGLAEWIGSQFTLLNFLSIGVFLLIVIIVVNFLTEITSNIATASMLLPILAAVALEMNVHPFSLMIGATLASSCAFMLPVATPPNAVVFGSGFLKITDMAKAGFWMNIISIIVVFLLTKVAVPLIWNFDVINTMNIE
jgi:solute carrier family 13 (sodium-dependent dicarboxylate transporter), member 2/3/5